MKEINWENKPKWQQEMFKDFGESCAFTGSKDFICLDHLIPRAKCYGEVTPKTNLLPLCRSINASKGNRNVFVWYDKHGSRLGISEEKFTEAICYIAEKLGMNYEEYKTYYGIMYSRPSKEQAQLDSVKDIYDVGVIDFRKTKYVMVPKSLVNDKRLTGNDKTVYMSICSFVDNNTMSAYPSTEKIAENIGVNQKTVFNALNKLEKYSYIERIPRKDKASNKQTSNVYVLLDVD